VWGLFLLGKRCAWQNALREESQHPRSTLWFSALEDLLRDGEEIQITKRKHVIARLLPPDPAAPASLPGLSGATEKIFGKRRLKVFGTEQLPPSGNAPDSLKDGEHTPFPRKRPAQGLRP